MIKHSVEWIEIDSPKIYNSISTVTLSDETMKRRLKFVKKRMLNENIDTLVFYADKEHGSNFQYLTGFYPRFEEALLVLPIEGEPCFILGNENLKMVQHSRLKANVKHSPLFSLPNQPQTPDLKLSDILSDVIGPTVKSVGIIGWKLFTTEKVSTSDLFEVPHFIIESIQTAIPKNCHLINAGHIMIGTDGVRSLNCANEIAYYEYGANLSSTAILESLDAIEVGLSERELGNYLLKEGQFPTVVPIAASGKRFEYANFHPTDKCIQLGDPLSLTVGYRGGLSSRTGLVVKCESELSEIHRNYLEEVAKPYFNAITTWLETIKIGQTGHELYQIIESVFPKNKYHWHLNPGHLTADEEWMCSPIYLNSTEIIKSGMIFQLDLIPSVPGYPGIGAEDCVAIADEALISEIKEDYPEVWKRIQMRRTYLENVLNIKLNRSLLPLSNTVAYLRPFLLEKNKGLRLKKED